MNLPLVEEIREARRLAEEATDASMQLIGIGVALQTIAMIETQMARTADPGIPVPGDDVVDGLAERWPSLGDLPAMMPPPNAPYLARLQARRSQLDGARKVLKPVAEDQSAHAQRLARLQHEQRHILGAPQYAVEMAALSEVAKAREGLARDLEPMNRLIQTVTPAIGVILGFEARLGETLHASRSEDPGGHGVWRAAHIAYGLLQGLAATLNPLELGIRIPSVPPPPSEPDAASAEVLHDRLAGTVQVVRALREDMEREVARVRRESSELTETYERLTRKIVDRMG